MKTASISICKTAGRYYIEFILPDTQNSYFKRVTFNEAITLSNNEGIEIYTGYTANEIESINSMPYEPR